MNEPAAPELAVSTVRRRATTPIAGAVAGILFAVLFSISVIILYDTVGGSGVRDSGSWLAVGSERFKFALGLIPFAGIFFLWFIAVARQRLGRFEDQFFATVFLGSGLLFLAMIFGAAAAAGAIAAAYSRAPASFLAGDTYQFARQMVAQTFAVYALKMAAVFLISQATLWRRTGVMPRWMALLTYALALVLLFIFTQSSWIILIFPAWVFLVSVYILVKSLVRDGTPASGETPATPDGA
jgi:hypothetical protein